MFKNIYKTLSLIKDISAVSSGDSKKIIRRGKNKIKGRLLSKLLNHLGFWRW